MLEEKYIDHEVRIRLQEKISIEIKEALIHLENKMESRFNLLIGLILTSMILPIIFHAIKWM
jgi:hypothetical protein